jgi:hypothetical protein
MCANNWYLSTVFAMILASGGCAGNPAPRGWLSPAQESQADPYGAWIVISTPTGPPIYGEFLAVERDSIFLRLTYGTVRGVPVDTVVQAQIAWYDAQWGQLAWWTAVGSISTISHGVGLIFTAPTWGIGGSIAARAQSRAPLLEVNRPDQWNLVRMYARFPGGLPANLPQTLPPKPLR